MGKQDNLDLPVAPIKSDEPQQTQSSEPEKVISGQKTNTLAIVALILAFIMPLIGLILGIIALVQIKKKGQKGKGLAIAAIIIPVVFIGLFFVMFAAYFGILDPARITPERCQSSAWMSCIDKASITSSD